MLWFYLLSCYHCEQKMEAIVSKGEDHTKFKDT